MNHTTAELLHINLNLKESSIVLEALAECPFKTVFELIGKMNHQAQQFYAPEIKAEVTFVFTTKELACTLQALGNLPYNRVSVLLMNLHEQLAAQKIKGSAYLDERIGANE